MNINEFLAYLEWAHGYRMIKKDGTWKKIKIY
jgi:hypothetical protein